MSRSRTLVRAVGAALCLGLAATSAHAASEKEQLEELRNTVVNLLQVLVDQGVMSREKAQTLVKEAQERAAADAAAAEKADEGAVRVTYVPEIVRQEIGKQVAAELRGQVVADVAERAKTERWGVPAALPDWLGRIRWNGEVRLRTQGDFFGDDNLPGFYVDFTRVNDRGGLGRAGDQAFFNVAQDRFRTRIRAQLAMETSLGGGVSAGARLVTGNARSPVSPTQTLGEYGSKFAVSFDQAYLRWDYRSPASNFNWFTLQGGRTPNPYLSSELLFDRDVTLDGVSGTVHLPLGRSSPSSVFLTLGAHPLEEVELASADKWLYAGQLGADLRFLEGHRLRAAVGYFDFHNVQGRRNSPFSTLLDYTAPRFMQKGNTVFDIRNDLDVNTNLFALAGKYEIAHAVVAYDAPLPGGLRLTVGADYIKNLGWKSEDVLAVSGLAAEERTEGYQVEFGVGHENVAAAGKWRAFVAYRHTERDAMLDSFVDSNFHLGGTDAQGFIVAFELGLWRNVWMRARYFSADEIDGPPYFGPLAFTPPLAIDVAQIDLNAAF